MSNKRTSKFGRKSLICAFLLLVSLLVSQQWWGAIAMATGAGRPMQAAAQVAQVWDNVRNSKQYDFSADVTVKTIPLPRAGNIGRFSKTDSLYLEGSNSLRKQNLQMAMWGGGISVADRSAAYQVRVLDGSVQTRVGDGEWQSSNEDAAVAFAPGGDFLSFLDMAKNVALADESSAAKVEDSCTGADCSHLTAYTFDLDSRAYAQKMVNLYQEQLSRSGKLPLGATLQLPDHLVQTTGSGELWVDDRGLPVRQKVNLSIPPVAGADNRSEAVMDIHFTNYQSDPPLLAAIPGAQSLVKALASTQLPSPSALAANLGLFSLTLLGLSLLVRPGQRTRIVMTVATLIAILVTPTLQAQAATVALDRLSVAQTQQKKMAKGTEIEKNAQDIQASMRAAGPYRPPEAALNLVDAAPALQSAALDSDGDGLTDQVENLIGSSPYSKDSDLDTISDRDEVVGFSYNGKTWYGNPLWADSNNDGAIDGMEWKPSAPDSDGDGTPDLYDFDDDGDGVPDNLDISRLVASKDNGGNLIAFSQSTPLTLTVEGLQANRYTYVNLQLRPTNPNQLWYAFNVLNWPKDEKGNMQDWDEKTFFDYCKKTGGSNCNMSPDDNGDIKIIPMLEVTLPDQSSLPRTANGAIDTDLLSKYGINVRPSGNGGYLLYAPLTLVEDSVTGNKVAFSTQLIYQNAASWKPEQLRLSWLVQVLNETYNSPEAADKALKAGSGMGQNQATILYAYYTDFYLTGLNVREDHGVDLAIAYEDPATDNNVNEDDALMQMIVGLDASYMVNRDCDFTDNTGKCVGNGQRDITIPTIKQRWDSQSNSGVTEGQRWGIPANRLRVETYSFAHEDAATMIGGGQYAPAILDAHFRNTAATKPSLLFVRESRFRASNIDVRAANTNSVTWSGRAVKLNLSDVAEMITGSYTLAPYQFNSSTSQWTRQTPQEYVAELERRYPISPENAPITSQTISTGDQTAVIITGISATQGSQSVLSQNGSSGLVSVLGNQVFKGVDITDESLRRDYAEAIASSAKSAVLIVSKSLRNAMQVSREAWDAMAKVLGNASSGIDVHSGALSDFTLKNIDLTQSAKVQALYGVISLAFVGLGILVTNLKGGEAAGQVMLAAITAINSTVQAVMMYRNISSILSTVSNEAVKGLELFTTTLSFSHALNSGLAKASAVGAVIGIGVTWVLFFAAWGKGGLSTDSVEFNSLLAGTIGSTLTAVVFFLLSLSVVGTILIAVFAVFDLIALIICKAGVKLACSLGITEAMTKLITEWIYTGGVMIDTKADPAITNIDDAQIRLTRPEQGLVAGNSARFEIDLFTYVRHAAPEPGIIYHYGSFFTPEDLRSTTVKYSLDNSERKLSAALNQTNWGDVIPYSWVEAEVPSPVVGWLVPTTQSKTLYHGARTDVLTSGLYQFSTAKINQQFPLYLNTGLALPRYDCWFQVCTHKSTKSTISTDLGKSFILDILPVTFDQFAAWSELGPQVDPDGDGLGKLVDPDQTKWDTDNDGVPDGVEYEYGIKRGYGFNPRVADADSDSLNDALEIRYQTNPRKADTDGDGISDFDEVNGYMITLGGQSFFVTSNPNLRDTDKDGMSDGVERRLNGIDANRYPFNPRLFNEAPTRLYTTINDADRVFAVNQHATVTTTVLNGTAPADSLLAAGVFTASLPAQLGGATQTRNFSLLPSAQSNIVLNGQAAAANGDFTINAALAADIVSVGTTPSGPADDIILDGPVAVTIDSDLPSLPTLSQGAYVQPGRTVVIGGTASDPTSYISKVEVSVGGGGYSAATGTDLWAFSVDIPNAGPPVPINVRAYDAVNNNGSANFNLTLDSNSPNLTVNLHSGDRRRVQRNAAGAWTIQVDGTVNDVTAGVKSVTVQIGSSSNHVITPTVIVNGAWSVTYTFDELSFNADPSPTGNYTLTVTARDNALPDGNPTVQEIPFVIDMTPPTVTMLSHRDDDRISDNTVFTGTVQDTYSSVAGVEYAFVDASTVFSTEETLLQLPLNDLPSTVLFRNNATNATRIFCLDQSCPTSGVPGTDGTAVSFDGNDLLRSFDTLDLPESGLTTAFWFKTTCANCGLFSAIAGQFPTQTGHDRDLFLSSGNVCSAVQVGASLELRCSGGTNYADNNWHQVVHTLGTGGNRLYIDGALAVSSPTTASTFTAQDRVLVGYAATATTSYLTGAVDDFFIYNSELSSGSVASLYRRWQPATLNGNAWSFAVPSGLEGYYQIDMRAVDSLGNRGESRGDWPQLHTAIDTKLSTFDLKVAYAGSGSSATTIYSATVRDDNLSADNYKFACPLTSDQLRYATDPALLRFAGSGTEDLAEIVAQCTRPGFQSSLVSANACDEFGHCAAAIPSQSVAYIGTTQNTLSPFGSLPNAIERVNLSDPRNRVRLIERPGQLILDIAVDEAHGKLYWAEKEDGSGQTAGIWRANLDGSSPTQIVSGLNAYAAEALQIAIDPAGNKLYWTQGYQLWWANLDGTLKQVVYSIPPDIRFIGGAVEVMQIGDVVVDGANGHLYLSERRQRGDLAGYTSGIRNFGQIFRHTLIVTTNLNGASPDFFAGAGAGCTYANFYDNLGSGVGAGQKSTLCLTSGSDGFDVEAMAVRNGTLYWSAIDADHVNGGVYARAPISSTFKVASLGLSDNSNGLRLAPLPQLYIDSASIGVFVGLGTQIVRGERDGSFSQFTNLVDNTPAAPGSSRRNSSTLSAFTVIETAQVVQQDTDLAVGITAPSTVVVNGGAVRYDMTVRNDAALPAISTTLTMTLPQGASFASASRSCVNGGATVRCDFGNFGGLSQQSLSISLTIATSSVHPLTTTVSVASNTVERNPANNSAVHSNITAAPNLSAFSGLPYIYYGHSTELIRVPLFGDYTSEPLFLSPSLAGSVLAADHTRNKLFLIDPLDKVVVMNPDGSGRLELANANPNVLSSSGRLHIAVDENTGRVYWSEIATIYLTTIKSAKPDGSDIQTVVSNVMDQRGLLVDPIRGKLFWVAGDTWQRQEFIYRSNLDGSNREIIYAAPAGSQIRYLALDPYAQKLYWIDPVTDDGTLFWSDADGGRVAALPPSLSNDARGLVVQPAENALYYVSYTDLMRANLDGSNETVVADLSQRAYDGLRLPLDPTVFTPIFLTRPSGNLVLLSGTPFASPPCSVNDTHEPNNSAATATAIGVGNTTGALCKIRSSLPVDMDFYTITVPSGKQLNLTLSNLPANYDLYLQRAGVTLASSVNSGLANDTISLSNYDNAGSYVIVVFSNTPINNVNPYTLNASLSDAPTRTVFTNAECLAVDPNDAAGGAGNYQQSQATPLTVGVPITGALCYQNDVDFYSFNAVAGQAFTFDLPVRPAAYELHLYRPNGSFFNAWSPSGFNQPIILDATGQWAVSVRMVPLTPTLATYQLLVSDSTCSLNDSWEPNNTAVQVATLNGNRVNATLCNASDADFYRFTATAGQRLTLNYPVNHAGGALRLLDANGAEQGRVLPGNQGNFVLETGNYTLATSNGALTTNDAAYTFQWLLNAPQPGAGTDYIYLGNLPHLVRVALSGDHAIEALSIVGPGPNQVYGAGYPMVANAARDQLYLVDSAQTAVISATTSGLTSTVIITSANPAGINASDNGIAIDEVNGYLFWTQPYGAINSNTSTIMRANLDGSGSPVQIKQIYLQNGLLVDSVYGQLYWVIGEAIFRSNLDGSGQVTVRDFTLNVNDEVKYLTLDPLARQLYWIDPLQNRLVRRSLIDGSETTLVSGLSSPHGIVLRPERNELYYTSGDALLRANLDGSNPVQIATLSGQYNGPWNLNPNSNFLAPIAPPSSNMVLAKGAPLLNPCTLADGNEPNNDAGTATALSVVTQTVAYGAICGSYGDMDYYKVSVADRKTLSVTLSELPANYRVIVQSPVGVNQSFSDNDGLADEVVSVSNTSGATVEYTILVLGLGPVNNNRYKLTLELGDVPPPPNPSDLQCGAVDSYDTPGVGNGTLATATSIGFGTSLAAALCYSDDVDMYAFAGLAGQSVKLDLPVRPQDYTLTLYDPSGAPTTVISSTTSPAYGDSIVLNASGRYTVAVSFPNLTPTTDQYQLFVTDENCVASDANEPNNSVPLAKVVNNGSRVRATLCSASDVDLYRLSATAGQQLTINYPANATGASLRVVPAAGGADLGVVSAGNQGLFTIPSNGDYLLRLENNGLSGSALPYLFEVLLGSPTTPTSGTPYLYYSRVSDLIRTSIVSGTVEPILLPNTFVAGSVIAADSVRSKLYILDYSERIVQANPDGTAAQVVVANTGPDVLRFTESLAVDERSGRIYWTQATFGVVSDIRSANGDGSDVQTLVTGVVDDHGLAVDPVAGRIYWAQTTLYNGAIVDHIRRSNLDGSNAQTIYAAPEGRQIRELTVDPYAQTLYWRDPTQNELLQIPADGGEVTTIATVTDARGFVVRPLLDELYYVADSQLWRADRNGNNPVAIARLDGEYNGVSNLDSNVFYPTVLTPPGSNLALANSVPFEQPCSAVDAYEPNDTLATATAITTGTLVSALCTASLTQNDLYDYYKLTVADGQQISVTLTNLPQDYGLVLIADGVGVGWSYNSGTADEFLTHINRSGGPVVYTILVLRNGANSSRLPYTLIVEEGAAPPPPPPPAPPADACAPYDLYDQPGYLGNQTRDSATPISFNTPITAALCYQADADYYSFDGVVGQNVTIDLPTRPEDYYISIYDPNGNYVNGIFPGSWLNYGDKLTLNSAGRWTLVVWYPNLQPTTSQYQLLLSVNTTCSGLDPYEPNNDQGSPSQILTRTVTLRTMLCETNDWDWYSFPVNVGDRIQINLRSLSPGMRLNAAGPQGGFFEFNENIDAIMSSSGDFMLAIAPPQNNTTENLPYVIDVQLDAPPAPTPLPNNWSCSVYPSSDIPKHIDDLTTFGSTVNVPVSGTVTHVGLRDITFDHGGLYNLSFGLGAPDGTVKDLFAFDDYGFYVWCGGSNCQLSLDDAAQAGLRPPQFPNNGGTFRPSRNSFAPFNGKASNGTWTFYVTDNGESGGGDVGDTTGELFSWGLEVCVDNGNAPDPTPTPVPTSTPEPQPTDGAPTGSSNGDTVVVTPTVETCALTADSFEDDDTALSATAVDMAIGSSAGHNFDRVDDADWQVITLTVGLQYTFIANTVDSAQSVSLALYQSDGTTLIQATNGQLIYEPTSSGRYYLRTTSNSGLSANLCRSDYSIVIESDNPNATPVPLPTGTPQPPNHDAPPISAAILAPTDGSALTTTQPITILVGLNTENEIQDAALFVNGSWLDSYLPGSGEQDVTWQSDWTPSQAGVYSLTALITDTLNLTATSSANVVYVDLAGPSVSIISETVTLAKLASDGSYPLQGTAIDDSQVAQVEVRLDGGDWQQALLNGSNWSLAISPAALDDPDGGNLAIEARATDKAGRTANTTANIIVDVTPPEVFTATTSLLSGALISPSQVVTELNARLSWPAVAGAVSIYAGWTVTPTATLNSLTAYGAASGTHDQAMPEGSALYAHVVAVDALGNQREYSAGPFYFDSAQTPDAIADLDHEDWVTSGGKQVGQMSTAEHGAQKLFVGWDATQLRLRWQGVNLSSDGDLYLYLGTGSGGSTALYNPYGASQSGVLPFAATYLVRLSDGITPTLLAYSGSWITQTEVAAMSNGALNDVVLSFADLGISNPAGTTLKVVGVASVKGTLDIWATLPDKNLGQTWNQFIQFGSLGSGIVPANGVWADAQLEVKVLASPAAGVVGAGDSVSLTVAVQNVGSAPLPQLTVNGSTSGGAALNNVPQTSSNLPVSGTVELTMNGTINSNGQIMLTLADSYHRPYQLTTLDYTVDLTPPSNVTVASSYANPGSNTAYGFAQDESSINRFDLEVNGSLTPCTSFGFAYQCVWDAGNATEGSSFSLRGKATDAHGNEAWSDVKSVQVDSTPPTLALSAASQAALSDGRLNNAELGLTGTLSDTVAANSAQLCSDGSNCTSQSVLADGSWTLFAPALGDGVTTTLSIVGDDVAGNVSQPLTRTVIVDSVAPSFGPTTINQGVFISNVAVLLGYGTVTDGDGVAGVQLYIVRPDGSSTAVTATLNITSWTGTFLFDQVGVYQVVAVATDLAGNQATQVVGEVTAQFAVIPPQSHLLTVRVVGSGVVTPSLSSYISGTVVPITATANPGWSFANWSGAVVTTTNPTSIRMDADKILTATFTQNSYTVTTAAVGNGTIQIAPQQSSYRYGDVITLTATAATGRVFSGWSGDLVSSSNPVTLTVTGNKAITGTFALQSYTLTLNQSGNGSGSLSNTPSGSSFPYGSVVTVTATANSNSFFAGWSGAVTSSSNPLTLTMDSNKILTATFSRLSDYTLTVNIVGNGLVTPTTSSYISGTVVPITATAATGWSFSGWSGDLSGNANPTSITLDRNKVITATFTQDVVVPPGDIDGDSAVNVIDLQLTINMIQAGTQPNTTLYALEWWQRADLNHDSQWNVIDLQMLINLIFAANAALITPQDKLSTEGVGNTVTTGLETQGSFSILLDNSDAIASGQLHFTYDASLGIQIIGVQVTSRTSGFSAVGGNFATGDANMAGYQVIFYNLERLNIQPGTGAILTITYTTSPNATGVTPVHFTGATLVTTAAMPLSTIPVDGSLTVNPPDAGHLLYLPVVQR